MMNSSITILLAIHPSSVREWRRRTNYMTEVAIITRIEDVETLRGLDFTLCDILSLDDPLFFLEQWSDLKFAQLLTDLTHIVGLGANWADETQEQDFQWHQNILTEHQTMLRELELGEAIKDFRAGYCKENDTIYIGELQYK